MNEEKFIETHCHLDILKKRSLNEVLQLSRDHHIEKIITIGARPDNLQTVIDLAKSQENIFCTLGVHPHDAKDFLPEHIQWIKNSATKANKVVAIGEIGLDYHYNFSPKDKQLSIFQDQLEIAVDIDLPVVIHSREADDDMISFLKKFGNKLKRKGVLHSFSSSLKLAEVALEEGFYLGFNGMITFKKADEVREALKRCPLDKLLFETDSPYLAPIPHRGQENAPHFIPLIADKAYEIRQETNKNIFLQKVYQNSLDLFQLNEI